MAETTHLPQAIVAALRNILPASSNPLPLHEPEFAGNEWAYVKDCLDTGWVSSVGAHVDGFERMLAELCGTRHAVAVVNGTAALHVALLLAGVGRDDEVLVPALTFVATANAVSYLGAVPHFVDACETTLGMDPLALDRHLAQVAESLPGGGIRNRLTGRRIAALVPMHVFGHPCAMNELTEIATRYNLALVEDAAEALGSLYGGRPCGSFGLVSALSFNGNKIVTTGGGGAILTDDADLARRAKHLTTTAKLPHRWDFVHDEVGFNFRLPNLNAALGRAQLERLPDILARKRRLALLYAEELAKIPGLRFVAEPEGTTSNYWLNAIVLEAADRAMRDAVLEATHAAGFLTRPVWEPLNTLPMYRSCPAADLSVTRRLADRLVNLPSGAGLMRGEGG